MDNELSINRALKELQLLDKRIVKNIENGKFIATRIRKDKIDKKYTDEEFKKMEEANLDSIFDLIERRILIKSKIVESNATTQIDVNGKKMSVADAIELKSAISYKKKLLKELKNNNSIVNMHMIDSNINMEQRIEKLILADMSREDKNKTEIETITKAYKDSYECILVDPLNIEDLIKKLEFEIDEFESNIDYLLSESNTIAKITI